jgi:hypothetical protein
LNLAHTLQTQLNVFADFRPILGQEQRQAPYVFLANMDPEIQLHILDQLENPELIACDTMNFWIDGKPEGSQAGCFQDRIFCLSMMPRLVSCVILLL